MRRRSLILIFALAAALPAQQKPATTVQLPPKPLLPISFAGWTAQSTPQESTSAVAADQALLTELGFKRSASSIYYEAIPPLPNGMLYKDGHAASVHADQFEDATGAFGAFSLLPHSGAHSDKIGNAGWRSDDEVIFWIGDTVVRVDRASIVPLPPDADLQALAKTLPIPFGSKSQIPALPQYLPKQGLTAANIQYALGPAGMEKIQSPLAGKLDFNTGAEVVTASYGSGLLTLVEYPTPQMAAAQLKTIAASLQLAQQHDDLFTGANMAAERSGPIVALASGLPQAQAIKLAGQVHYEAEITWNHPEGYVSDAWRAAHLYLGIFALAGILCAASVILGLFFGGARAITRVLRGKSASAVEDTEFISLDLGTGGELHRLGSQRETPPAPPKD